MNKSSHLGAKTYKEGKQRCRSAGDRVRLLMGQQPYGMMITAILQAGQHDTLAVAEDYGFDRAWLDGAQTSKKGRREAAPVDSEHTSSLAPAQGTMPQASLQVATNAGSPIEAAPGDRVAGLLQQAGAALEEDDAPLQAGAAPVYGNEQP